MKLIVIVVLLAFAAIASAPLGADARLLSTQLELMSQHVSVQDPHSFEIREFDSRCKDSSHEVCSHPKVAQLFCCPKCCADGCCDSGRKCNAGERRCEVDWGKGGLILLIPSIIIVVAVSLYLFSKNRGDVSQFDYREHVVDREVQFAAVESPEDFNVRISERVPRPTCDYYADGKRAVPACQDRFWSLLKWALVVIFFVGSVSIILAAFVTAIGKNMSTAAVTSVYLTLYNIISSLFITPQILAGTWYAMFEAFRMSSGITFQDFWFGFFGPRYRKLVALGLYLMIVNFFVNIFLEIAAVVPGVVGVLVFLFIVIPLFIWTAYVNMFSCAILIDQYQNLSARDALKGAYAVVSRHSMHLFLVGLSLIGWMILAFLIVIIVFLVSVVVGFIFLIITLAIILPWIFSSQVFVYHALVGINGCHLASDFGVGGNYPLNVNNNNNNNNGRMQQQPMQQQQPVQQQPMQQQQQAPAYSGTSAYGGEGTIARE